MDVLGTAPHRQRRVTQRRGGALPWSTYPPALRGGMAVSTNRLPKDTITLPTHRNPFTQSLPVRAARPSASALQLRGPGAWAGSDWGPLGAAQRPPDGLAPDWHYDAEHYCATLEALTASRQPGTAGSASASIRRKNWHSCTTCAGVHRLQRRVRLENYIYTESLEQYLLRWATKWTIHRQKTSENSLCLVMAEKCPR